MPSGVLRVNARPAKIKLRIKSSGAPASANVEITDVMFQPGASVSGWLPHVTEMPWVSGVTDMDSGGGSVVIRWEDVEGKPISYPPANHTHAIADVAGLQGALDGKALVSHTHPIADVDGLQAALDGKQATGDYATNAALTSGLAGKSNTSHNHTAAQTTSGIFSLARIPTMDTAHIADASITSPKLSSELASRLTAIESDLAVTSGFVTLTDATNFAAYAAGQEPRAVKKAGFVTVTGAMRLLTAGYIDSGAGRIFGKLPAGMEPGGNTTLAFVSQGSNNDRYSLLVTKDGQIGVSRYGPASSPLNAWLNIGITYQQVV